MAGRALAPLIGDPEMSDYLQRACVCVDSVLVLRGRGSGVLRGFGVPGRSSIVAVRDTCHLLSLCANSCAEIALL